MLSVIICDLVIIDRITNKPSIIGAFETISASKYPARHPRLVFFCQLTNGHGKTRITVKLVDVQQKDKTLFEGTIEQKFRDVREVANLTLAGWCFHTRVSIDSKSMPEQNFSGSAESFADR